jgi:hypothetical protein
MIIRLMVWPVAVVLVALFAVAGMCITIYNKVSDSHIGEQ